MRAEVTPFVPGGSSPRKRYRKPFPLGAPRALVAPVEGLVETARALAGAERAAAFAMEGREVTAVATCGEGEPLPSRIAARALAEGCPLLEQTDGRYVLALPVAEAPSPGSERRRYRPRSSLTSACLVLEGPGEGPGPGLDEARREVLGRALIGALEARSFADSVATDRSSGALNRPAFERAAQSELALSAAAGHPAALLLLEVVPRRARVELEQAEEAMAAAAAELRRGLRAMDLVGRRGPDELAVLLLDVAPGDLGATVARLVGRLGECAERNGLEPPVAGAASFPAHGAGFDEVDAAALDALEGARAAGAGTWRVHDPELGRSPTACRRSFFTGDAGLDARKASLLFESVLAANSARELREALDAVLRALLAATGADRAAVLSGDGSRLEVSAASDSEGNALPDALRFSRSACLRSLALGRAILLNDISTAPGEVGPSAYELRLRSVVAVPLLGRTGPLGVLYADSVRPSFRGYGPEDLAYLEALAAQAALAIENAELRERLEEENAALKRATRRGPDTPMLLGTSAAFRDALVHLPEIIEGPSAVLLLGESGTGKEMLARTIHELGPRGKGGFVAINCAAIPLELLESELFGHAAGAFSGASRAKRGLLELADGGTLFLDEIADLPFALQAKLLRVLEDKEVRRIGETRSHKIDFRLVCATNRDLMTEVEGGRFRRDLYYRINVFTVTLPPLRERREDIPELARHFVMRAAARLGRPQPRLAPGAIEALVASPWPGNVRELANVIEKAVALARDGAIEPRHLGLDAAAPAGEPAGTLRAVLARVEADLVAGALRASGGNVSSAARALGVARQQLQRLMKKHAARP